MISAVVTARMGSTRLAGKCLRDLCGRPLLGHLIDRLREVPSIEDIVLATTNLDRDNPISDFAQHEGLLYVQGDEADVLDRIRLAVEAFDVQTIVRVTPDCPLLDPEIVERVLRAFLDFPGGADYGSNLLPRTFPDGYDVEVLSRECLDRLWKETEDPVDREHVTRLLRRHPERFRVVNVAQEEDLSALRLTVDTEEDFRLVEKVAIAQRVAGRRFGLSEVLSYLRADRRA